MARGGYREGAGRKISSDTINRRLLVELAHTSGDDFDARLAAVATNPDVDDSVRVQAYAYVLCMCISKISHPNTRTLRRLERNIA